MTKVANTKNIEIYPLAGESFGVRSFCFLVKTPDLSILLDPGCALGPKKNFKIPHPLEFAKQRELTQKIVKKSEECDFIFISHFHHDHFKPLLDDNYYIYSNLDIFRRLYDKKTIFIKRYNKNINYYQKKRGKKFYRDILLAFGVKNHRIIRIGEDRLTSPIKNFKGNKLKIRKINQFEFNASEINYGVAIGETNLIFPVEVLHGVRQDKKKIYIQGLIINYRGETFYYFPDVQGMSSYKDIKYLMLLKNQINSELLFDKLNKIGFEKINNIIAFGGMRRYNENSVRNTKKIIENFHISIIDHHIIRERNFPKFWKELEDTANATGNTIIPMNTELNIDLEREFNSDKKIEILERNRKLLYEFYPPSSDFKKWAEKAKINKTSEDPPKE
ncbi:MAG: MBL fold metallo-hydrolase [Promethearchaeota archaeon]